MMDAVSRVIYKVETKLFIVERIRGKLSDIKTLSREVRGANR